MISERHAHHVGPSVISVLMPGLIIRKGKSGYFRASFVPKFKEASVVFPILVKSWLILDLWLLELSRHPSIGLALQSGEGRHDCNLFVGKVHTSY